MTKYKREKKIKTFFCPWFEGTIHYNGKSSGDIVPANRSQRKMNVRAQIPFCVLCSLRLYLTE